MKSIIAGIADLGWVLYGILLPQQEEYARWSPGNLMG